MLTARQEKWPIDGAFTISRGSKTVADVVVATFSQDGIEGRGECVPYGRYGESVESVLAQIRSVADSVTENPADLLSLLPAGAARNAVDCALWDWQAKASGQRVWTLLNQPEPVGIVTAYTLSVDTPEALHEKATAHADRPLLKLKLAGDGDLERVAAIRRGAPKARIVVDANEGWTVKQYDYYVDRFLEYGISAIEQPLPAGDDAALACLNRPIPVIADESCHDTASLERLIGCYDMVNIKLDKTGGLTEALTLKTAAKEAGLSIMVGCMVGTSLAMAPALMLCDGAQIVDLDGPLLLARDRNPALPYSGSLIGTPPADLWG